MSKKATNPNTAVAAVWEKEKWIKDALAKSGTELTEIKQEQGGSAGSATATVDANGKGARNIRGSRNSRVQSWQRCTRKAPAPAGYVWMRVR